MTKAGKSRDGGGDKSLACIYMKERSVRNYEIQQKTVVFWKKERDEKFVQSSYSAIYIYKFFSHFF